MGGSINGYNIPTFRHLQHLQGIQVSMQSTQDQQHGAGTYMVGLTFCEQHLDSRYGN